MIRLRQEALEEGFHRHDLAAWYPAAALGQPMPGLYLKHSNWSVFEFHPVVVFRIRCGDGARLGESPWLGFYEAGGELRELSADL